MIEGNQPREVEQYGLLVGGLLILARERQVPWTTLQVLAFIAVTTLAGVALSLWILSAL